ncbi:chemotaxis protein CheB [Sphingomonas japonica]|uniref:chemotaxis protein CheB n=1 Tax=Sphingomonas japonica TaxID=511662 RepID=UPI002467B330|nr:chemotaxis protein CheB [Sphingomonas japonica]
MPSSDAVARVLIVDDSLVARSILARLVDAVPRFAVAAAVGTAEAALAYLETEQVAVILLDLEMPGVTGLAALPDLLAAGRGARVLVVSSTVDAGAATTIQALALGAAGTLVKPGIGSFAGRFGDMLADQLQRLIDPPAEAATLQPAHPAEAFHGPLAIGKQAFSIVGIGASTGGIHALSQVLRPLTATFQAPIVITQHLPVTFSAYFAAQVALLAGRPCDVAEDRMRLQPGRVVVAPGDAHLVLTRMTDGVAVRLSRQPAASRCMPSVDPMLQSLAALYGDRALGIMLSGMGRDGAQGAADLVSAGGTIVAQDRASSVVWGMPGAVAHLASAVLSPDAIGALIAKQRCPA